MSNFKGSTGIKPPFISAVIAAAGSSSRMGFDKITADLCGMPVIARTVSAFCECSLISEVIIVTSRGRLEQISEICRRFKLDKVSKVIVGADERMKSVLRGLAHVDRKCKYAAVHDGARPLVSSELIERVALAAVKSGAAAPGVAVKDTVKQVSGGVILRTLDRSVLAAMQTPQIFDIDIIKTALHKACEDSVLCTDDCAAVEYIGGSVLLCAGDYENIKLTTPDDMLIAREILKKRDIQPELRGNL